MSGTNHQDTTRQADGHGPELPPAGPDIGAGTGSVHRIEEGQLRHTPTCACGICLRNYGPVDQRQYPPTEEAAKSRQEKRAVLNIDDPSFIMSETRVYQTIEALRVEVERLRAALEHIANVPPCTACQLVAQMDPRRVARLALERPSKP